MSWSEVPGECIVCGARHSACGATGPIEIVQTPAKDAAMAAARAALPLPTEEFTTATSRRKKRKDPDL